MKTPEQWLVRGGRRIGGAGWAGKGAVGGEGFSGVATLAPVPHRRRRGELLSFLPQWNLTVAVVDYVPVLVFRNHSSKYYRENIYCLIVKSAIVLLRK